MKLLLAVVAVSCLYPLFINSEKVDLPSIEGREWRAIGISYPRGADTISIVMCHMQMGNYHREPWLMPMDNMLQANSSCKGDEAARRIYRFPDLLAYMRWHPNEFLEPTGFIHHETRCGSTMVANMIARSPTALMVTESMVPYTVARFAKAWWKDVPEEQAREYARLLFQLLCHTTHGHTSCTIKLPGATYMDEIIDLFPDTPWIFMFRDPQDVMVSNMKGAWGKKDFLYEESDNGGLIERRSKKKGKRGPQNVAPCLRTSPHGKSGMTPEVRCAVNLREACEHAAELIRANPNTGLAIDYDCLPNIILDRIWGKHFTKGVGDVQAATPYMLEATEMYSKAIMIKATHFEMGGDTDLKEKLLTESISSAVKETALDAVTQDLRSLQKWPQECQKKVEHI